MTVSRNGAILSVMVLMCIVDGEVAEPEVLRIRWIYERITGSALTDVDVRTVIGQVSADATDLDALLLAIGKGTDVVGRRLLIKAAFGIASADGKIVNAEDAMMVRVAKALQIAPEEYRAVVNHLMVAREFG